MAISSSLRPPLDPTSTSSPSVFSQASRRHPERVRDGSHDAWLRAARDERIDVRRQRLERGEVRAERPRRMFRVGQAPIPFGRLRPESTPGERVPVPSLHRGERVVRRLRRLLRLVTASLRRHGDLRRRHQHRGDALEVFIVPRGREQRHALDAALRDGGEVTAEHVVTQRVADERHRVRRHGERRAIAKTRRMCVSVSVRAPREAAGGVFGTRVAARAMQARKRVRGSGVRREPTLAKLPRLARADRAGLKAEVGEPSAFAIDAETVGPEPEGKQHLLEQFVEDAADRLARREVLPGVRHEGLGGADGLVARAEGARGVRRRDGREGGRAVDLAGRGPGDRGHRRRGGRGVLGGDEVPEQRAERQRGDPEERAERVPGGADDGASAGGAGRRRFRRVQERKTLGRRLRGRHVAMDRAGRPLRRRSQCREFGPQQGVEGKSIGGRHPRGFFSRSTSGRRTSRCQRARRPSSEPALSRAARPPMSSRLARVRTAANTASAQALTPAFYAKVVGISFAVGACMELFMVKTGFYEKVTAIEAERREALSEPPAWVKALQEKRRE